MVAGAAGAAQRGFGGVRDGRDDGQYYVPLRGREIEIDNPPPMRLAGFNVFPYVHSVLEDARRHGLRLGVISNSGDDDGAHVNQILETAGLLAYFDRSLLIYSKAIQESAYQVACIIAVINIALSLGLFGLYRFAAGRLGM